MFVERGELLREVDCLHGMSVDLGLAKLWRGLGIGSYSLTNKLICGSECPQTGRVAASPSVHAVHETCGMLCHQIRHCLHRPSLSNSAINIPSRTMHGRGAPGSRAMRWVPLDLAQIWKSSSDATW